MKKRVIALGPGAASLILIVVALSMSVLGMLTLMSARGDRALAQRSVEMARNVAVLNDRAEESLCALDALLASCAERAGSQSEYEELIAGELPENMTLENGRIRWTEQQDDHALDCSAALSPWGEQPRCRWDGHGLTVQMGGFDDLWN